MDLRLPYCRSLKEKRTVLKPILEGARRRFAVAAAEVNHQDRWQRSTVAVAVVASSAAHVIEVLENVERFVCGRPDVEVIEVLTRWLDHDG